jgi:hypothetical protein
MNIKDLCELLTVLKIFLNNEELFAILNDKTQVGLIIKEIL